MGDLVPILAKQLERTVMDSDSGPDRRGIADRRSGMDTRSAVEKQLLGERRSGVDRRTERTAHQTGVKPADEQLALFARRLKRALANEKGRDFFGVMRGEDDFAIYPEVLRTLEWLEALVKEAGSETGQIADQKVTIRKAAFRRD